MTSSASIDAALADLLSQRELIEAEIQRLIAGLRPTDRPLRTCLRCGYQWRSYSWQRLPRGCARCGSSGWNTPPITPDARHPEDPPNPRWPKRAVHSRRRRGRPPIRMRGAEVPQAHVIPLPPRLDEPPVPVSAPSYSPPRVEAEPQPESYVHVEGTKGLVPIVEPETVVVPSAERPADGQTASAPVRVEEHRATEETSAATPVAELGADEFLARRNHERDEILAQSAPPVPSPEAAATAVREEDASDADEANV